MSFPSVISSTSWNEYLPDKGEWWTDGGYKEEKQVRERSIFKLDIVNAWYELLCIIAL